MRLMAIVKVAFRALRRNKLRTVLTMLGIIIGVGAVITMVALGRGAKAQVQARIAALGQNVILFFSGSMNRGGVRMTFWPSAAMRAWTWALAPRPSATIVITAPTPIMMPSMVSTVRSLLRRNARKATLTMAINRIINQLVSCASFCC